MQFKSFAILALSATGAVAAEEKRQILPTDSVGSSIFSVLATAIPPDVASLAINNPNQLSAQLASSISAGQTPSWYQALPSDVKSYLPKLFPASASATPTPTPTPSNTNPIASVVSSIISSVSASVSASVSNALNSTTISTVKSATLSPSSTGSGSGSSASGKASSASSSGGAAYPTAVVGAGVAGALGFLGMLAL